MPDPNERHSRSKWDYGQGAPRSGSLRAAAADDPDPARRAPGRKDKARCHANRGGPHVPVLRKSRYGWARPGEPQCRWEPDWSARDREYSGIRWRCLHFEACEKCGKHLTMQISRDRCPDYPGVPAQRAEALAEVEERNQRMGEHAAWRRRRRWDIPGYRKRKASA
jgi:hypothetical protein